MREVPVLSAVEVIESATKAFVIVVTSIILILGAQEASANCKYIHVDGKPVHICDFQPKSKCKYIYIDSKPVHVCS